MGRELPHWRSKMKSDGSIQMDRPLWWDPDGSIPLEMSSILVDPSRAGAGLHPQPGGCCRYCASRQHPWFSSPEAPDGEGFGRMFWSFALGGNGRNCCAPWGSAPSQPRAGEVGWDPGGADMGQVWGDGGNGTRGGLQLRYPHVLCGAGGGHQGMQSPCPGASRASHCPFTPASPPGSLGSMGSAGFRREAHGSFRSRFLRCHENGGWRGGSRERRCGCTAQGVPGAFPIQRIPGWAQAMPWAQFKSRSCCW